MEEHDVGGHADKVGEDGDAVVGPEPLPGRGSRFGVGAGVVHGGLPLGRLGEHDEVVEGVQRQDRAEDGRVVVREREGIWIERGESWWTSSGCNTRV